MSKAVLDLIEELGYVITTDEVQGGLFFQDKDFNIVSGLIVRYIHYENQHIFGGVPEDPNSLLELMDGSISMQATPDLKVDAEYPTGYGFKITAYKEPNREQLESIIDILRNTNKYVANRVAELAVEAARKRASQKRLNNF